MVQDNLASNAKIMYTGMKARSEIRWDGHAWDVSSFPVLSTMVGRERA